MKPASPIFSRNRAETVLFLFCAALFVLAVTLVFITKNNSMDEAVFAFISKHRTPALTRFMLGITFLGNHSFLIPANCLLVIYFFIRKNKRLAIIALTAALSSLGVMSLLKNLFHRHRPVDPLVTGITNFSFPSGHAFMSVAFYGLLIFLITGGIKKTVYRTIAIISLFALILLIGFSRIYLRVHYTSDVLAGFALGFMWLAVSLSVTEKIQTGYFLKKNTANKL